jgi:hypothetical protein
MSPEARQLCRASNTISSSDAALRKCPRCGTKLNATEFLPWIEQGRRELRPVVPAHVRNERGEVQARINADRSRYPGVIT